VQSVKLRHRRQKKLAPSRFAYLDSADFSIGIP
jgi:hypothetical protein